MSWGNYLFSFQGRINRAKLWLFLLVSLGAWIAYIILFSTLIGLSALTSMSHNTGGLAAAGGSLLLFVILGVVLYIGLFVAWLAVTTKRLHDRDKSAVWILVFIVAPLVINVYVFSTMFSTMATSHGFDPQQMMATMNANPILIVARLVAAVLSIWGFVELYCLRGTAGDNRYGPDPLAGRV
jgi:uncharacterized membrane protein YhaH (DUF805 family)